jgi:hypothetical protein
MSHINYGSKFDINKIAILQSDVLIVRLMIDAFI